MLVPDGPVEIEASAAVKIASSSTSLISSKIAGLANEQCVKPGPFLSANLAQESNRPVQESPGSARAISSCSQARA